MIARCGLLLQKIINLLDFKPEKLSINTENDESSIKVHQVRYENGGFYLTIDNIKSYFSFSIIKLLLEKNNKFYLELSLNHLSYKL